MQHAATLSLSSGNLRVWLHWLHSGALKLSPGFRGAAVMLRAGPCTVGNLRHGRNFRDAAWTDGKQMATTVGVAEVAVLRA